MLEWAEIDFEVVVSDTDETFPGALSPEDAAVYVATQKAEVVRRKCGNGPVILAADTMVVLDHLIIGKPASRDEAIQTLQRLSGNTHQVITGVHLSDGSKQVGFWDRTQVTFHQLNTDQITWYVDNYQPYDKAGGYAIQEWIGVTGIKHINGDFYNVMGLPISRVVQTLNTFIR